MPESLKTFLNRCRCCLERFFDDEKPAQITYFLEIQFLAFTCMELKDSELLSKFVCEFCRSELLRFSVFKKDLIEKQQRLNELLKHNNEKYSKPKVEKIKKETIKVILISDDDDDEENPEEDNSALSEFSSVNSDDDKDQDFSVVRANGHVKKKKPLRPKISPRSPTPPPLWGFTCDYCEQTFKAKQGLTRHVQSHIESSVPWKCDVGPCSYAVSSKIKLNLHKLQAHNIPIPLSKSDSAPEKKNRQKDVKTALVISEFSCFCGATFSTVFSLRAHKNRMHGRRNKCTYGCENVQYVKAGHFLRHVQNKHPDKLEECLKRSESYITKLNSSLLNNISFEILHCDKCDFKTLKKASLKSHIESHLPYTDREKFTCEKCHKVFTRATSLRVHRQTIHEKIRRFKCPKCRNVAFKQLGHLNDHLAFKHSKNGKKHFKCKLCDRFFLKRYMMNRHMRLSHKSDPRQTPLVTPIRKPKGENPFKCFCGKEFPFQSRLLKHQLKHEEDDALPDKPFKCPEAGCLHAFTQRCNLIRHQKAKGHLRPEEIKNLKYFCHCGAKFFSYRGYGFHCDKNKDCKKKSLSKF